MQILHYNLGRRPVLDTGSSNSVNEDSPHKKQMYYDDILWHFLRNWCCQQMSSRVTSRQCRRTSEKKQVSSGITIKDTQMSNFTNPFLITPNPSIKKKIKPKRIGELKNDTFIKYQHEAERFKERWKKVLEMEERRQQYQEHELRMMKMLGRMIQ